MVATCSIQISFPFPVKQCLNIRRESKKLNVFRHVDTTSTVRHIVSSAFSETGITGAL